MTNLADLFVPEAILPDLASSDKETTIRSLVRALSGAGCVEDEDGFVEAILHRENIESTGIGLGVAIPHARTDAVSRTVLAFGRTREGIDFNSLDGKPSRLVFLIAAPESNKTEYIMTLARVSRLLRRDAVREALLEAETPDRVIDIIRDNG